MSTKTVGLLVANYNNGSYLSAFFESILSCERVDEIVFVDDGSNDCSHEILRKYQNSFGDRLRVIMQENRGFANALNAGLDVLESDYVARIDPDDVAVSDRFRRQAEYLDTNPHILVVGSNVAYFQGAPGCLVGRSCFREETSWIRAAYEKGEHGVLHGSVMARRGVLSKYRYDQKFVPAEDYLLFGTMSRDGVKMRNLPEVLTKVRVHSGSVSNDLPLATIVKTNQIRSDLFGRKLSFFGTLTYYYHMKYYRRFLFSKHSNRYLYLCVSALFRPSKVFKRLLYLYIEGSR